MQLEFMKMMNEQQENQRKHEREMAKLQLDIRETLAKIEQMDVQNALTLQEAKAKDLENDANEAGILELAEELEEFKKQSASG